MIQVSENNSLDFCQLTQSIAHFNNIWGENWWQRISPQLGIVLLYQNDFSTLLGDDKLKVFLLFFLTILAE